jgi:uncharacterized pyridoxal phosphate-containing UPF0001 family protein
MEVCPDHARVQAADDDARARIAAVRARVAACAQRAGRDPARDKRDATAVAATWHLVGGLQRNKAKLAAAVFDRVQTVDSAPLADALGHAADAAGKRLPVLVQVDLAGRAGQRGVPPEGVADVVRAALGHAALAVDGLMTIAPPDAPEPALRAHFGGLRALRDDVAGRLGVELPHLSMGMSNDFPLAIEEGATIVRLGRALFGERGGAARREGS